MFAKPHTRAPGPAGHRLLGSLPELRRDIVGSIDAAHAIYGDLVRFRIGPLTVYAACSPELAEEVLIKRSEDFPTSSTRGLLRTGFAPLGGSGLLSNPDHRSWFARRRIVQPMFHRRSIASMATQIVSTSETMLQRWQELAPGSAVNFGAEMMALTLEFICRAMFSTDIRHESGAVRHALHTATTFLYHWNQDALALPLTVPMPSHRAFHAARRELDRVIYAILDHRLGSVESEDDLLQLLLTARDADTGAGLTRQELRDEMVTIFLAGHDTTAHALTWSWYLLSQHPAALRSLQAEVDTVLGGRPPAFEDLAALPYARAVFQEAMRLYPPAPLLFRRSPRATTLGGYELEAGSRLSVSVYSIHRRAELWEDPGAFRPERFLKPAPDRHKLAYLPFGAGQHMCVGNQLALMEGQLVLALLAQRYRPRLAPGQLVVPEFAITLRPKYPIHVLLDPRGL